MSTAVAAAQVYTPPPGDSQPSSNNSGGDTVIQRQPQEKNSKPVFGNELPFLDPSSELVSWNGHTWSATDNRLLAARFERYLNEPADDSDAALEYRETIEQILEYVSPHHPGGPDFSAAVRLLPRASGFPGDAKLCDSLSQAIYAAVLAKKDVNKTRTLNTAMEDEKQRLIDSSDWKARHEHDPSLNQTAPAGGGGGGGRGGGGNQPGNASRPAQNPGAGVQSLEYQDALRRIAEIEALKKTNTAKNEIQLVQAKIQYQALMIQFFVQRRFQHVMMAARFYHQIFTDGDNQLHIDKKSDVSKMISETFGTSPTVAALDSLASEAIRDIDKGVDAFKFLSERGELESAAKRLSEAYMVGEFMPSIQTLPREEKRRVLLYVRESYKLIAALDAKDYDAAAELVESLKETAGDFDATKAEAAIATYTRVSNMHIDSAKLAASTGDNEKAASEIQKAMEVWPQNPKLAEFDQLVNQSGALVQARNDFDRLLSENNYREILKRQYEIAPAIQGDSRREDAFKQIITNIYRIDGALAKASEFSKMGQDYAAWEQLAKLREEFPDDPKLGRELEQLAPDVADFTKALNEARSLEERRDRQIGSALSWYLKARSIYPASSMAQEGIDRLVTEVLPREQPEETRSPADDDGYYED
ncbi:hypothetical protein HAHE_28030 [Haloferula helveola]|uniref:Uncharacterized protein n=2 Tax=Haloferula helveola TaxID=490095 RepID=A0ABM7RBF0_9BACT|nr:hypothetical protein HAHE_28030 [Haloferula helveola]